MISNAAGSLCPGAEGTGSHQITKICESLGWQPGFLPKKRFPLFVKSLDKAKKVFR
jgi:hypothetical protein